MQLCLITFLFLPPPQKKKTHPYCLLALNCLVWMGVGASEASLLLLQKTQVGWWYYNRVPSVGWACP